MPRSAPSPGRARLRCVRPSGGPATPPGRWSGRSAMTTDPVPGDTSFDVPEMNLLDDGSIRRAVRRGIVLTALVAAAWVLLATVVLYIGALVLVAVHTERFHNLAYYGA